MGMTDEWDIFSPASLGVHQHVFPVFTSMPTIRVSFPAGARMSSSPLISGHWPAYQKGTSEPYCFFMSFVHSRLPVVASHTIT